jgi:nucleoside-diphosphate-sugar epimerase
MPTQQTVLVVGGTGRTGRRLLEQLLARGVLVRAIVRSPGKLPEALRTHPGLTLVVADLLELGEEALQGHVRGCSAVVSCLGHVLSFRGVFGPPRDLVAQATHRLCRAIEATRPAAPVKLVLMSSVSVHGARGLDTRRGTFERALMAVLRALLPPAEDNQRAADFLRDRVGVAGRAVQWVVVRPDALMGGDVSVYEVHDGLVNSLRAPGRTDMANVAHFMCELVTDPAAWQRWQGKWPVVVNATTTPS